MCKTLKCSDEIVRTFSSANIYDKYLFSADLRHITRYVVLFVGHVAARVGLFHTRMPDHRPMCQTYSWCSLPHTECWSHHYHLYSQGWSHTARTCVCNTHKWHISHSLQQRQVACMSKHGINIRSSLKCKRISPVVHTRNTLLWALLLKYKVKVLQYSILNPNILIRVYRAQYSTGMFWKYKPLTS